METSFKSNLSTLDTEGLLCKLVEFTKCNVCLEEFPQSKFYSLLECNHSFCEICLCKMKNRKEISCPICRKKSSLLYVNRDKNELKEFLRSKIPNELTNLSPKNNVELPVLLLNVNDFGKNQEKTQEQLRNERKNYKKQRVIFIGLIFIFTSLFVTLGSMSLVNTIMLSNYKSTECTVISYKSNEFLLSQWNVSIPEFGNASIEQQYESIDDWINSKYEYYIGFTGDCWYTTQGQFYWNPLISITERNNMAISCIVFLSLTFISSIILHFINCRLKKNRQLFFS